MDQYFDPSPLTHEIRFCLNKELQTNLQENMRLASIRSYLILFLMFLSDLMTETYSET